MRLPQEFRFPEESRKKRVTGSRIYGFLKCEHSIVLDLLGDPSKKLEPSEGLALLMRRGVEHEERIVAELGYETVEEEDFEAAAARTLALMREGAPGISQGVLRRGPFLGIPDLLRREEGESVFGDYHYIVGDIKSSHRPRSDQALQVSFYSMMLAELQGRDPEKGYLVLREGNEEEVPVRLLQPVVLEVLEEMEALLAKGVSGSSPHRSFACLDCGWRAVCAERGGVSWIPGLSRTGRELLREGGFGELGELEALAPEVLVERVGLGWGQALRAVAGARVARMGVPLRLRRPRLAELRRPYAGMVALQDGFDRRFPVFGSRREEGEPRFFVARTPEEERGAFEEFLGSLRGASGLVHDGAFRHLFFAFATRWPDLADRLMQLEARSLDVLGVARGAYQFPGPVRRAYEAERMFRGEVGEAEPAPEVAALLAAGDFEGMKGLAGKELEGCMAVLRRMMEEGP
ncbi:MAG TPA: TM0106 family RecB-like putative nuclease [Planctomycetes bacterium]|nr:TM0106 family RecB-like putative nuclease [Planctomycetota bacterium]